LYKDVASEYVQVVMAPEQLPNVLDRAIRTALSERAPTAIIVPLDVQEMEYSPPTHDFKMVPSSVGISRPEVVADHDAIQRAAAILNDGEKVATRGGGGAKGRARRAHRRRRSARRRDCEGSAGQGRHRR